MPGHADILDQPERLRGPFWGSICLHTAMAGLFIGATVIHPGGKVEQWGDPDGGRFGSVAVNSVASIPLPNRSAAVNPVANDTKSQIPQAPPTKKQLEKKLKTPDPDAISIKSKSATAKRPVQTAAAQPNKWADAHPAKPNQLTSTSGQAISSPMYNLPGGGGVGVGTNSPFGNQFGAYAALLRDQVARNWHTSDIDARVQTAPPVAVTFSILRNGQLVPGSVRVSQSSGNRALDFSAMRAIMDAAPFPGLPPQYNKNQADIELRFELRR
jgi:protein TonB